MELQWLLVDIIIAYGLDLILGDPQNFRHPVRYIGKLIRFQEKIWLGETDNNHNAKRKGYAIFAGAIMLLSTILVVGGILFLFLEGAKKVSIVLLDNYILFHIVNIYILYTAFAGKCLADEGKKVAKALQQEGILGGRRQIGYLVSRDTAELDEQGVIKATVETVAENTVDGVVSPQFYAVLGAILGMPAVLVYVFKGVSTLDSMVGYRNERYEYFGKFSARMDDVLNFIPARMTGFISRLLAPLVGGNSFYAIKIFFRDRNKHKSPNAGHAEASFAGALKIQLGGGGIYFGKWIEKPFLGEPFKNIEVKDIFRSIRLLYFTSAIAFLLFLYIIWILLLV